MKRQASRVEQDEVKEVNKLGATPSLVLKVMLRA